MSRPCQADALDQIAAEQRFLGITGLAVKQGRCRRLHADGNRRQRVGEQVDKEQVHSGKGSRQCHQRGIQHTEDTCHIAGQQEADDILDVLIDAASVGDSVHDGGEVVVCQDHGGGVLAHLGTG